MSSTVGIQAVGDTVLKETARTISMRVWQTLPSLIHTEISQYEADFSFHCILAIVSFFNLIINFMNNSM